jgi:hypothetical protein
MSKITFPLLGGLFILLMLLSPACIDPCLNVYCENGGYCLEGTCECPNGYYGESCEYQQTPSRMLIKRIRVENWPFYQQSGYPWEDANSQGFPFQQNNPNCSSTELDLLGRPDLYILVYRELIKIHQSGYRLDCNEGQAYEWDFTQVSGGGISVDVDYTFRIRLYDKDCESFGRNDDYISGFYLDLKSKDTDFPSQITIGPGSNSWNRTRFVLDVEWYL